MVIITLYGAIFLVLVIATRKLPGIGISDYPIFGYLPSGQKFPIPTPLLGYLPTTRKVPGYGRVCTTSYISYISYIGEKNSYIPI